nr:hypothetical protein SUGSMm_14940 [Morganella morganii subsp. sibonii]
MIYTVYIIANNATTQLNDAIYEMFIFYAGKENGRAVKHRRLREEIMKGSGMENLLCYAPGKNKRD